MANPSFLVRKGIWPFLIAAHATVTNANGKHLGWLGFMLSDGHTAAEGAKAIESFDARHRFPSLPLNTGTRRNACRCFYNRTSHSASQDYE